MKRPLHSARKFDARFMEGARLCSVVAAVIGGVAAVGGAAIASSSAKSASKDQKASTAAAIESSDYQADLADKLGRDQLAENKRIFDENMAFNSRIADSQLAIAGDQTAISKETAAQGKDYYDYQKSFRPVEQRMMDESMVDKSGEVAAFDAANQADAAALTADDATVYGANRGAIDAEVGQAVADTQGGYTRSLNQAMRQGLRYGGSGAEIAGQTGALGLAQASATAAAANGTRTAGVSNVRQRLAMGLQLRGTNVAAKNSQEAINWAKKLDAAGIVKNLPGASNGAYGLAIGAGNSAVNAGNSAANVNGAPGSQYLNGMNQGANTILSGANAKTQTRLGLTGLTDPMAQAGMAMGGKLMGFGTSMLSGLG